METPADWDIVHKRRAPEICADRKRNASFTMPPGLRGRGYRSEPARMDSLR
jgi:hypothetical protein